MTAPPVSPNRRAWDDLVRVARAIPTKAAQRIPSLTPAQLAIIGEVIDEALADAADGR